MTRPWIARLLALCCAGLSVLYASSAVTNGGFETNGGAGSNTFTGWTVATQPSGGGNWVVQTATTAPVNVFAVPVPPEGNFAAMTDGRGPGSQAMLQTFTVPPGSTAVLLSFRYFRNNVAQDYSAPNKLDFGTIPNQQARVDILRGGAVRSIWVRRS